MTVEEMEVLCREATPGPWKCIEGGDEFAIIEVPDESMKLRGPNATANAAFITMSRALIPKLLEIVKTSKEAFYRVEDHGGNIILDYRNLDKYYEALEELERT